MKNADKFEIALRKLIAEHQINVALDAPSDALAAFVVTVLDDLNRFKERLSVYHIQRKSDLTKEDIERMKAATPRPVEIIDAMYAPPPTHPYPGCKPVTHASVEQLDKLRTEMREQIRHVDVRRHEEIAKLKRRLDERESVVRAQHDYMTPQEIQNAAPLRPVCAACEYGRCYCHCGVTTAGI